MRWRFLERCNRWLSVPGESEKARHRKTVYFYQSLCLLLMGVVALWQQSNQLFIAGNVVGVCGSVLSLAAIFWLRRMPYEMIVFTTFAGCFAVAAADLGTAAAGLDRWWPVFVIVLDLLLVSRARGLAVIVVSFVVFWMVLVCAEESFRFGLFDLPILPSTEDRVAEYERQYVCEDPPCPLGWRALQSLVFKLGILVIDFVLTRWFSDQVLSEKARMETAAQAANDIASALAAFDLCRARESLNAASSGNLPAQLSDALEKLLANLMAYRPYLPDALFDDGEVAGKATTSLTPPGLHEASDDGATTATIVFTDIVQSTAIWNACSEHMKRALQLHNSLIRSAIAEYRGYEVKTIGDAFMAAFGTRSDAMMFALVVQARLYAACWPPQILVLPQCPVVLHTWRGLRIRVGMHAGPVSIEKNTVTGRYDYFGPTVNMAARLESNCLPGGVAALPEFVCELEKSWIPGCTAGVGQSYAGAADSKLLAFTFAAEELVFCDDFRDGVAMRTQTAVLKGIGEVSILIVTPKVFSSRLNTPSFADVKSQTGGDDDAYELESLASCSYRSAVTPSCWVLDCVPHATFAALTLEMSDRDWALDAFQRAVDSALQTAVQAINKTEGTLMTVLGHSVFASWNASSRRVPGHVQNSFHFTRLLRPNCHAEFRCHVSSGKVKAGTVGTDGQKFFTVFGGCVGLACSLAAAPTDVPAVYCPHAGVIEGRQRAGLRPVGWCRLPEFYGEAGEYVVYQIEQPGDVLRSEEFDGAAGVDASCDWGWSPEYWQLFLSRDLASIRQKLAAHDDATLRRVLLPTRTHGNAFV
ncbi:Adenylate cyclase [Diplonema papillatum]|nr:Adenylate cyclase [Diplonema papillatum]